MGLFLLSLLQMSGEELQLRLLLLLFNYQLLSFSQRRRRRQLRQPDVDFPDHAQNARSHDVRIGKVQQRNQNRNRSDGRVRNLLRQILPSVCKKKEYECDLICIQQLSPFSVDIIIKTKLKTMYLNA